MRFATDAVGGASPQSGQRAPQRYKESQADWMIRFIPDPCRLYPLCKVASRSRGLVRSCRDADCPVGILCQASQSPAKLRSRRQSCIVLTSTSILRAGTRRNGTRARPLPSGNFGHSLLTRHLRERSLCTRDDTMMLRISLRALSNTLNTRMTMIRLMLIG